MSIPAGYDSLFMRRYRNPALRGTRLLRRPASPAHTEPAAFQAILRDPAMHNARVSRTFLTQLEAGSP